MFNYGQQQQSPYDSGPQYAQAYNNYLISAGMDPGQGPGQQQQVTDYNTTNQFAYSYPITNTYQQSYDVNTTNSYSNPINTTNSYSNPVTVNSSYAAAPAPQQQYAPPPQQQYAPPPQQQYAPLPLAPTMYNAGSLGTVPVWYTPDYLQHSGPQGGGLGVYSSANLYGGGTLASPQQYAPPQQQQQYAPPPAAPRPPPPMPVGGNTGFQAGAAAIPGFTFGGPGPSMPGPR